MYCTRRHQGAPPALTTNKILADPLMRAPLHETALHPPAGHRNLALHLLVVQLNLLERAGQAVQVSLILVHLQGRRVSNRKLAENRLISQERFACGHSRGKLALHAQAALPPRKHLCDFIAQRAQAGRQGPTLRFSCAVSCCSSS